MQEKIVRRLHQINAQFYQTFAGEFSNTRQRLQPGVRQLLPRMLVQDRLLDLGCGNGELARQLAKLGFSGEYTGVDFSPGLLEIAAANIPAAFRGQFIQASLLEPGWEAALAPGGYDMVTAFAALHPTPGAAQRQSLLRSIYNLLQPEGTFIHSNWQFMRSPRLARRIQPWESVGLADDDLEPGDTLLDWRQGGTGLRYVHHFSLSELADLAAQAGFSIDETFDSDGASGDLSVYQVWRKG
jgi:tRNA (uracil-5-)-methyltransferase TRM9